MATNSKIKLMQRNLAAFAWQKYIKQIDNDLIEFVLEDFGCIIDVDWNRAGERQILYATFEDDSVLVLLEDRQGYYRFQKILEPAEVPDNYTEMEARLEEKIKSKESRDGLLVLLAFVVLLVLLIVLYVWLGGVGLVVSLVIVALLLPSIRNIFS